MLILGCISACVSLFAHALIYGRRTCSMHPISRLYVLRGYFVTSHRPNIRICPHWPRQHPGGGVVHRLILRVVRRPRDLVLGHCEPAHPAQVFQRLPVCRDGSHSRQPQPPCQLAFEYAPTCNLVASHASRLLGIFPPPPLT